MENHLFKLKQFISLLFANKLLSIIENIKLLKSGIPLVCFKLIIIVALQSSASVCYKVNQLHEYIYPLLFVLFLNIPLHRIF